MAWRLPTHDHRTYSRNPLEAVIVQLRFDPILKVGDHVADFQDGIRGRFPKFEVQETQSFEINPALGVRSRSEREYRFQTKDGSGTVFLSTHAVALETRAHIERDALLGDFAEIMRTLREVYDPVSPLRLGLRYVNIVDRKRIGSDLESEVAWADLVAHDFIQVPCDLADLDGISFGSEFSGALDGGRLTLRYGMVPEAEGEARFRLDIDRYAEQDLDVDGIPDTLMRFAGDIFSVFRSAAGPELLRWMREGKME
jgi:uncharacterized protein (TIGR04255 family)